MESLAIVVGLGNPGARYRSTRHNLGFWVVDRLAGKLGAAFQAAGDLREYVWTARGELGGCAVLLAKPRTYMNRSGRAVAALCGSNELANDSLTVVYDDADLEFGRIRIRSGGGAGGHNGVRSLIEVLGHGDFNRVRLGVRGEGRDADSLADYVLDDFLESERTTAVGLAELGVQAIEYLVTHEIQQAMNRFNGVMVSSPEEQLDENG